jgi:acyl carrier protein
MMDYYKKFIRDEYEWVYGECTDSAEQLLEEFNIDITPEEFEDNFGLFIDVATSHLLNNDDVVQYIHDGMHDDLSCTLTEYSEDKEKFIEKYKPTDDMVRDEIEEEIVSAFTTLRCYNKITKDVLIKNGYVDKQIVDLVEEFREMMSYADSIESVDITFNYTDESKQYKVTRDENKETTAPTWLKEIVK